MKADLSRNTFRAENHYRDVLKHQGSVDVDADRNEQQAINVHRIETEAGDVIGTCGAPLHDAGFAIAVSADARTLTIGKGRLYVDGILCENESDNVDYLSQPDHRTPPDIIDQLTKASANVGIVYLDVWLRHITALDDPLIQEKALGGPATSTRAKVVWQVKVLPVHFSENQVVDCDTPFTEWEKLISLSNGRLNAHSRREPSSDNPCLLPPLAGYQRLENQLYRVEIHSEGNGAEATFKWSRDNGSVVTAIESVSGNEIVVQDVGPDDALGFSAGQWVEISDDRNELNGDPGTLLQIDSVIESSRTLMMKTTPPAVEAELHPKLRRWDQSGTSPESGKGVKIANGDSDDLRWQPLEDGVEVLFDQDKDRKYRSGDYWLIPARTVTGEIEWPPFKIPNEKPEPQLPLGIRHHYCRLALVKFESEQLAVIKDCRKIFPPLTELTTPPAPVETKAIHVKRISWRNDERLSLTAFQEEGLRIRLDAPPDPTAVTAATMIVTLELPTPQLNIDKSVLLSFVLGGEITVNGNNIRWIPIRQGIDALEPFFEGVRQVLARVVLKGHAVWSGDRERRFYLDGCALGEPSSREDGTPCTALIFPSGSDQLASDFESWFFLER